MPSTSNQVSSDCYTLASIHQSLPASMVPSQYYGLFSHVNFSNRGVTPDVFESRSQLSQNYPVYPSPFSMIPSMPSVPAVLVNLVAQNQFVDFEYLLPANLTVIAAQPLISLQSLSRIPSFKLAQIQSLETKCCLGSLYVCNRKDKSCSFTRLIEYFDHV